MAWSPTLPPVTLPFWSKVIVPNCFGVSDGSTPGGGGVALRRRGRGLDERPCRCRLLHRLAVGGPDSVAAAAGLLAGGEADECLALAAGFRALALEFLEAELVVFLHLPHLLLHLQDLEVELLDGAGERADLLLESGDARVARLGQPLACSASWRRLPPPSQPLGSGMVMPGSTSMPGAHCARLAPAPAVSNEHRERAAQDRSEIHRPLALEDHRLRKRARLGFYRQARLRPNFVCRA